VSASGGDDQRESSVDPAVEAVRAAREGRASRFTADAPGDPVQRLLDLLEVEPNGTDSFRVENAALGYGDRLFGGQVAAQSLRAAVSTVEVDHHVHSLHAYFLRPGRPGTPIVFDVERTRDGRSFSSRRVLAHQNDEVIFDATVSFHVAEDGPDYQLPIATDVPDPDEAPHRMLFVPEEAIPFLPMEMKEVGAVGPDEHGWYPSTRRAWTRIKTIGGAPITDDPVVHLCLLTYLSDMGAVFAAMPPTTERPWEKLMGASLDHAMWFHRPMRADQWFLYDLHSLSNAGSRGLARGTMHTADGVLGVSVAQEALLRSFDPAKAKPKADPSP
jgi:acyl-CoA thioesterase-2